MKIKFNRDAITKGIIIGGLSLITLAGQYRFFTTAKKNAKLFKAKNNKQIEDQYESSIEVIPGYHLESNKCISNLIMLNKNDIILDVHTKDIPSGYHIELVYDDAGYQIPNNYHLQMVNDLPYAVYNDYHAEIDNEKVISVKNTADDEEKYIKYETVYKDTIIKPTNIVYMDSTIAPCGYHIEAISDELGYLLPNTYELRNINGEFFVVYIGYSEKMQDDRYTLAIDEENNQKTLTK